MENGKKPAFAQDHIMVSNEKSTGLTKREYFAGLAMQGLLTRVPKRHNVEKTDLGILESIRIAEESVIMADKLLAELDKPTKTKES
jgi:hypothetical protein